MFCNECGVRNKDKSKYCSSCGTELAGEALSAKTTITKPVNSILKNKEHVPCKGIYNDGFIESTGGVTVIEEVTIKSFWKGKAIANKRPILFDYDPKNKEAFNIREYPTSAAVNANHRIEVKGGDFKVGEYYIVGNGSALKNHDGDLIGLHNAKINIVSVERAQQKLKSVAIGAVGALATLGVGAVLGAMHASKKYNTIEIVTENGEFLIAQCRPNAYQNLYSVIKTNQCNIISNNEMLEAFKVQKNCENIENYFDKAKKEEIVVNVVTYLVSGIIILFFIAKCSN